MKRLIPAILAAVVFGCAAGRQTIDIEPTSYDANNTLMPTDVERAEATIYFVSDPPGADVFMGDIYVGKANRDVVRMFPGERVVTLIKNGYAWQDRIFLRPGDNGSKNIQLLKIE